MVGLTAVGTLSYNDYTFDGTAKITASSQPIRDDAARTVVYRKITISVNFTLADQTTDQEMERIRTALTEDGARLVFINKGFGTDLIVGGQGGVRDVKFGPKPEVVEWTPTGSANACDVKWRVTTIIPECYAVGGGVIDGDVLAMNFSVDHSFEKGYCTRTITGYIEVAQSAPAGVVATRATLFRDRFTAVCPLGFKRQQRWTESADKSRVDFTITDTEIQSPNPWPAGVDDISADHGVRWSRGNGEALNFRNSLTMTVERSSKTGPVHGWLIFLSLLRQKILAARSRGVFLLLDELDVNEGVFSYQCRFRAGWRILKSNLTNFVADSGLFTPTGTNWAAWQTSMNETMLNPYGGSQVFPQVGQDRIVSGCSQHKRITYQDSTLLTNLQTLISETYRNETPPPETSYMQYENKISTYQYDPTWTISLIQDEDGTWREDASMTGTQSDFGGPSGENDVIQSSGKKSNEFIIQGTALRAGYEIPKFKPPRLAGKPLREIKFAHKQDIVGDYFGVKVYRASWAGKYVVDNNPGRVRPPDNEFEK